GRALANRAGLARQDEEGRLENVLGVVPVAEQAAAHRQDHAAVPSHQGFKGGFIPCRRKALQQLRVRELGARRRVCQPVEVAHHRIDLCVTHGSSSDRLHTGSILLVPRRLWILPTSWTRKPQSTVLGQGPAFCGNWLPAKMLAWCA